MSDKTHDQAAISRRVALKKLGLGTAAFVAPTVMTVSEAEAKRYRGSKSGKRSSRSKSTRSSDEYDGEDYDEDDADNGEDNGQDYGEDYNR